MSVVSACELGLIPSKSIDGVLALAGLICRVNPNNNEIFFIATEVISKLTLIFKPLSIRFKNLRTELN